MIQQTEQTSEQYFSILNILYAALIAGQALFAVIAYFLRAGGQYEPNSEGFDETFQMIVLVVAIAGFAGSVFLFRNRLEAVKADTDLKEKMAGYRTALILKYALLEGPSLLSIVAYLLTGNFFYLGLSAILILAFLLHRPTRGRVATDLGLSPSERAVLDERETIITP